MATPAEINDAISEAASKPQSATIDGNSVNSRSIRDMLLARDVAATDAVTDVRQFFMQRTRLIPAAKQ